MKRISLVVMIVSLAAGFLIPAQEQQQGQQQEPPAVQAPPPAPGVFTYNPEGRRDPFKDLLGGRDTKEKNPTGGISQVAVEDLVLIGITKTKKGITAIVGSAQGLPYFVTAGDKFADGYVLSITESKVVLRKTHDRGVPLVRARDITKEINPEER